MSEGQAAVPVSANDRVSDVIVRDEALIDVFVRHAPHFANLRRRAMRRVMARLITVKQAARTANVSTEQLLDDLNAALGFARFSSSGSGKADGAPRSDSASPQRRPTAAQVVELDVRDDLRSGREPFSRIMRTIGTMREREVLHLRATFQPVPLFALLGKRGFVHESQCHTADDWSVWFWRSSDRGWAEPAAEDHSRAVSDLPPNDEETTYLDVRGLNPPEPMVRTLEALDSLRSGHALVQINNRIPQFLLPLLIERGFAYEIETQTDRVLVRISYAS